MKADPEDLQIVCRVYNIGPVPESETPDDEIVLTITKIANHPRYQPGEVEDIGNKTKGPYTGFDICVYHVDDTKMRLEEGKLWPACLPRLSETSEDSEQDVFVGWKDQEPLHRLNPDVKVSSVTDNDYLPRMVQVKKVPCADPDWMQSNTFYPAETLCYRDPSEGSCFQHGNSGSSVMTHFKKSSENGSSPIDSWAFTGPLSMHKGCDKVMSILSRCTFK